MSIKHSWLFGATLQTALIFVYLIIIAGSVVRMTGSGMGCPDWPKCFGYYIPPTTATDLEWKPEHNYKKNQVIIKHESLKVVKEDFTTTDTYAPKNWKAYTKHDYAHFNVVHTWIEYINRLLTALFGIPILILLGYGIYYFKEDKRYFLLSTTCLLFVAFEAWLGKVVVDSNLVPLKVTLHVLFVFFILATLIKLYQIKFASSLKEKLPKTLIYIGLGVILATMVQIIMGTQVRQYIDVQMIKNGYQNQAIWLSKPPFIFYIHRSFSILLILLHAFWIYKLKPFKAFKKLSRSLALVIGLEIISGILLYYLDFPFLSQPLHLLLSSILFGIQFYLLICVINYSTNKEVMPIDL